jgi:hypothetical protein
MPAEAHDAPHRQGSRDGQHRDAAQTLLCRLAENMNDVKTLTETCRMLITNEVLTDDAPCFVRTLTRILKLHVRDRELQEKVFVLLTSLFQAMDAINGNATDKSLDHVLCYDEQGGLEAVISSMNQHSNDADLQQSGCGLILKSLNLSRNVPLSQQTLHHAVDAVVACIGSSGALHGHAHCKCNDLLALRKLSTLVEHASVQDMIVDAVLACLRAHVHDTAVQVAALATIESMQRVGPGSKSKDSGMAMRSVWRYLS